jgi:phosphopantetheinyl transferase (holo-ACP synthase)
MNQRQPHIKFVDQISKEEFIRLFNDKESPAAWFTDNELRSFSFPRNAGSLGARYLIKKRICAYIRSYEHISEIEIGNDAFGKPGVKCGEHIRSELEGAGIKEIMCSISHSRHFITAMTIFSL